MSFLVVENTNLHYDIYILGFQKIDTDIIQKLFVFYSHVSCGRPTSKCGSDVIQLYVVVTWLALQVSTYIGTIYC